MITFYFDHSITNVQLWALMFNAENSPTLTIKRNDRKIIDHQTGELLSSFGFTMSFYIGQYFDLDSFIEEIQDIVFQSHYVTDSIDDISRIVNHLTDQNINPPFDDYDQSFWITIRERIKHISKNILLE